MLHRNYAFGAVCPLKGLVVLAAMAMAFPATAQTPGSNASPLADPLPQDRGLVIEVSGDITYDSNIFRQDASVAPVVDDFILTPAVAARYAQVFGRVNLRLDGAYAYSHYLDNPDRARPRFEIGGEAGTAIAGRCIVSPGARYLRLRSDFGDINAAIENTQRIVTADLSVACPREAGFYPFAEGSLRNVRNDAQFDFADEDTYAIGGGIGYSRPSIGTATAYYSYQSSERPSLGFTNRIDRIGVTFERAVVSTVSIEADLHYLRAETSGIGELYSGLAWRGALTVRTLPRLSLRGVTARTIVNDSLIPAAFAVQSDYNLWADYRLSTNTRLSAGALFGSRKFETAPPLLVSPFDNDRFSEFLIGAERNIGRRISLNLEARHFRRRTDTDINEYNVSLATIGASLRF